MTVEQAFTERMDEGELMNCMRCGFCLPSCPTYIQTGGDEVHSPRGRIAMMKAVHDGLTPLTDEMTNSLDVCLGCRACEPVCPAGVQYGHLLEEARTIIQDYKKPSVKEKVVRRTVLNELFPKNEQMNRAVGLVRFYQTSGLQKGIRKIGFLKLFPESMREMEKVLPAIPKRTRTDRKRLLATGEKKATVAFFQGCLMDTMFQETNQNTIRLLRSAGCDIVIPEGQGCCGALHGHAGEKEKAIEMAKRNIEAFEGMEADYIVLNAGGCGAYLAGYDHLLSQDMEWRERAARFKAKIRDFSSILIQHGFDERIRFKKRQHRVTYQDSCHLRNGMGVHHEPRQLIQMVEGADYVEMKNADGCCGSAGVYNLVQPEMSMQILDDKMKNVKEAAPGVIVTANPGCLLQMKLGIERAGLSGQVEAVHLADYLNND
ncbi:(Fe-S)-binding protein [Jeotgalibacillus terrae]|uniref:Glycolate oxidase iron-sulfur subunit n=1 Tax=Jeotgalibacillus terrae TaxID=587735 RepID=A0ABW5ZCQ0_9BACL|nr:(Fe-S)-binding protein [Jeotgalibacillus terrae]MBM7579133.1 glycolate oxidase iron-sulfur subunit [Jeotgalibacillus terrae]